MRKLLLLICICLPMLTFAQPGPLDVKLGLKAGMNFTRLQGSTWTGGYRSGILGGAFASVGVKKIGGQGEILISTTSFTGNAINFHNNTADNNSLLINPVDSSSNINYNATYIQIPVLLNLKLFGNAAIQLGPEYRGLLGVKDKDLLLNKTPTDIFNASDIGGVIGVQLNLPLKINAGLRYSFGFNDQNISTVKESWKLSSIQLHLGFSFL